MISDQMGELLWRRVYEARVNLATVTTVLPETLESLLRQAGVPEPEDDVVRGPYSLWHGRTMQMIRDESRSVRG